MNRNWLAESFKYLYDVVVEADKPIFMFSMVILPFVAPLLPALITANNLQKYMNFPQEWTWIGVLAFELVAMLSQMASVSVKMKLVDDPFNPALISESRRTGLSYGIYILTLISSNAVLEWVNGVAIWNVFVVACLTVGLSYSASLINATRIYNRDKADEIDKSKQKQIDQENLVRREQDAIKLEKYKIKHGSSRSTSETNMEVPKDLRNTSGSTSKMGRPSIHQERVFSYMDETFGTTGEIPTFTDLVDKLDLPQSTASRLRNEWIDKNNGN